jgi:hypothetical protein
MVHNLLLSITSPYLTNNDLGMPAAWMISSNGTEDTINFFLKLIHTQSPSVSPEIFMSDKDHTQMNVIRCQYPKAALFLCWWHVLHAW